LKIISIVTSYPRNEKDVLIPWIIKLIQLLKKDDVETEVFTSSYCGIKDEVCDEIRVRRFRYFFKKWEKLSHDMSVPEKLKSNPFYFLILPFFMFFGFVAAYRFGKKNDFEIIHVHFPFPLAIFGIAMKFASKKPMIVSCHGSEVNMAKRNPVFRLLFRFMMRYAEIITVNSTFMKKEVLKIIENRQIEVIPMGSGIGAVKLKEMKNKKGDKTKILYVGRLIECKGVKYLIDAFKTLDSEKYELHIVGDGPERERLEEYTLSQLCCQLPKIGSPNLCPPVSGGLRGYIHFHGYLSGIDLEKMYKDASVFVLPSIIDGGGYTEGLGTVLIEAILYGVPVIGSNVGGIPDIIVDGETGILVPEKDPKAIAEAIKNIVDNVDMTEKLVTQAKEVIADRFSWKTITNKFYSLYKKLSL